MKRQSGEGKNSKKVQEPDCETGFEKWKLWMRAVADRNSDPLDFFDPEEFGYQGRGEHHARP